MSAFRDILCISAVCAVALLLLYISTLALRHSVRFACACFRHFPHARIISCVNVSQGQSYGILCRALHDEPHKFHAVMLLVIIGPDKAMDLLMR